jgi:hypothetical protein
MKTLAHTRTFNQRAQRARIGASWPHDINYYRFQREHKSRAPFVDSPAGRIGAALELAAGALVIIGLAMVLGYLAGWL